MFDLNQIMQKVQEAQQKVKQAQAELQHITTTSESGAGMVKATVNGHKKLINIEIDKDLLKPEDIEMLQDLVVAATNKALDDIEIQIQEKMKGATGGMMPNIPGLDLSNFMK